MLDRARVLAENGHIAEAWKICNEALHENPESPHAMVLASYILDREGRSSVSYHIAKRLTQIYPNESAGWTNLGRCADSMWRMDEAKDCYLRSLELAKSPTEAVGPLVNLAATYLQIGDWENGKKCSERVLAIDPENRKATHNLGICQLAMQDWEHGWANYRASVGSGNRIAYSYTGEGLWDGTPGQTVVLSGEQGLGDEINAASAFTDVQAICKRLIVDCDPRLVNLFRRSFPGITFHGTRNDAELDWPESDRKIDASLPMMQAHEYVRTRADQFSGKPYLKADPDRVAMWKGLWRNKNGPVVGIAWSGGIKSTGSDYRRWTLADMQPVFDALPGAHFVSLQYKDAQSEIDEYRGNADIKQYPFATLTKDYDDTAALVASLDMVVSVQTSVIHLAGALGVPTLCGVSSNSQWRYGGDTLPWYSSVELFRQQGRDWGMQAVADRVRSHFQLRKAA